MKILLGRCSHFGYFDVNRGWHPGIDEAWEKYCEKYARAYEGEEEDDFELVPDPEFTPEVGAVRYKELKVYLDLNKNKLIFEGKVDFGLLNYDDEEFEDIKFSYEHDLETTDLFKLQKQLKKSDSDEFTCSFLDTRIDLFNFSKDDKFITWGEVLQSFRKVVNKKRRKI